MIYFLFQVFGRVMSGTVHANQQIRLLGENYSMFDEEDSRTLTLGKFFEKNICFIKFSKKWKKYPNFLLFKIF